MTWQSRERCEIPHRASAPTEQDILKNPNILKQHATEAQRRHLQKLNHPRMLSVLAVTERKDVPAYFVTPYYSKGSLGAVLKQEAPLNQEACLKIALQLTGKHPRERPFSP